MFVAVSAVFVSLWTHPSHKKLSDEVQVFLLQHDVREKGKQGFCCSADTERTTRGYRFTAHHDQQLNTMRLQGGHVIRTTMTVNKVRVCCIQRFQQESVWRVSATELPAGKTLRHSTPRRRRTLRDTRRNSVQVMQRQIKVTSKSPIL